MQGVKVQAAYHHRSLKSRLSEIMGPIARSGQMEATPSHDPRAPCASRGAHQKPNLASGAAKGAEGPQPSSTLRTSDQFGPVSAAQKTSHHGTEC